MNPKARPHCPLRDKRGFTLIELVITIAVIAILAALAYPSFISAIRKSRRSDAVAALTTVQQAQERWRNNQALYASNGQLTTAPDGLGLSATSPSRYYRISIENAGAAAYTLIATAADGSSQLLDEGCQAMSVSLSGGNLTYGGATSGAATTDPQRCWAR
jgi:type IV pilus assembly protein PilE